MTNDESQEPPRVEDLSKNRRDTLAHAARGVLGSIPGIGAISAEVVGAIIPQQRVDRVVSFLDYLSRKVEELDRSYLEERMKREEFVDLFEDGMHQATRALSEERKEHIATLLKTSLTSDDLEHVEEKRLLWLLGQVNDAELVILRSYSLPQGQEEDFLERHEAVLHGPRTHSGADQSELDRAAVRETFRRHLADLGLLRPRFKRPKRGQLPEFDEKTGMMKTSGYELAPLGRLLLRRLELPTRW